MFKNILFGIKVLCGSYLFISNLHWPFSGIRNLKTVSLHCTLPELGMDSMMAIEVKELLERELNMFLTAQNVRSMTFAR